MPAFETRTIFAVDDQKYVGRLSGNSESWEFKRLEGIYFKISYRGSLSSVSLIADKGCDIPLLKVVTAIQSIISNLKVPYVIDPRNGFSLAS